MRYIRCGTLLSAALFVIGVCRSTNGCDTAYSVFSFESPARYVDIESPDDLSKHQFDDAAYARLFVDRSSLVKLISAAAEQGVRRIVLWGTDGDVTLGDLNGNTSHFKDITHIQVHMKCQSGALLQFPIEHFSKLESLKISKSEIRDQDLRWISQLPSLQDLHLAFTDVTDAGIAKLSLRHSLRRLDISGTTITGSCFAGWSKRHMLTHLSVRGTHFDPQNVRNLRRFDQLRWIDIRSSRVVDQLSTLLPHLPHIRVLHLGGLSADRLSKLVGDEELIAISNCRTLEALNLRGTYVTSIGLAKLRATPRLRALDVSGVELSIDECRALGELHQLSLLYMAGSTNDPAAIAEIIKLKGIKSLNVSNCGVDDSALVAIATMPSIQVLNVSHTRITSRSVALLKRMRLLKCLDARKTPMIMDAEDVLRRALGDRIVK